MHELRNLQRSQAIPSDVPDVRGGLFVLLSQANPVRAAFDATPASQEGRALPQGACAGHGNRAGGGSDQGNGEAGSVGCRACASTRKVIPRIYKCQWYWVCFSWSVPGLRRAAMGLTPRLAYEAWEACYG